MEEKRMTCSFTGHREIEEGHESRLADLLVRGIEYAYKEGCRDFCTGGALGFDTLAARAVLLFRMRHPDVRLCLVLPCRDQDENWTASQKNAYRYILAEADTVEYVGDFYTRNCMRLRNMRLVERCEIMLAYMRAPNSGAGQTVRLANAAGKRVYNLYSAAAGR